MGVTEAGKLPLPVGSSYVWDCECPLLWSSGYQKWEDGHEGPLGRDTANASKKVSYCGSSPCTASALSVTYVIFIFQ